MLREIVELQSVTDKFFIRAFVAMQYFGYLRRDPDTIGYNNWDAFDRGSEQLPAHDLRLYLFRRIPSPTVKCLTTDNTDHSLPLFIPKTRSKNAATAALTFTRFACRMK